MNKNQKGSRKKVNVQTKITSLDVARWFLQENQSQLPGSLVSSLNGALRSRNVATIRKLAQVYDVPQLYERPQSYAVVAQMFALLTKVPYPFGDGDEGRKQAALDKFFLTEKWCRITTRRLRYYWAHPDREDPMMRVVLTRARALVDKVLGSVDRGVEAMIDGARFGPGMTLCSMDAFRTTPYYKFGTECRTVTATARWYADQVILSSPEWVRQAGVIDITAKTVRLPWEEVTSCRLTFVPKDERTFRTIAIEPYGNVMCQLGLHGYLAERLHKIAGITVHSQKWNQEAARSGSERWLDIDTLSTIDLSSASDCVSPGLVERLVRPQWVAVLDDLRGKFFSHDGVEYRFSKWSSMGNGYTFALETLLFWAIAQSCEEICKTNQKALVFGDDIAVSRASSLLVLQTLRYCGFRFNPSKTNITGPFRESCGEDYHSGVTVRPVFQKNYLLEVPDVYVLLNTLGKGASFATDDVFCRLHDNLQEEFKLYGPPSESTDSYIHAPGGWLFSRRPEGFKYRAGLQCHFHRRLSFRPTRFKAVSDLQRYLCWLYGTRGARKSPTWSDSRLFSQLVRENVARRTGALGDGINYHLEDVFHAVVTQRSRGSFRFSNARCHRFDGAVDRSFFLA
jgi:hypothetical protein